VLLDDLDKALEARGHRFVRYADDCNVYVRSERAGHRVMAMMRTELTRLRLRINEAKSAVDRPWNRRFLGYSFRGQQARRRVSPRALEKLKDRIRELTNRNRGVSLARVVHDVAQYLTGWKAYFHLCEVPSPRMVIERWIRSRLRTYQLKLWWNAKRIYFGLVALGAPKAAAAATARLAKRWWSARSRSVLSLGCPTPTFNQLGLPRIDW
jgi:RNA-directed DNA polymerase